MIPTYKSAYKLEVVQFTACCRFHNLALSVDKTKEMVIDFRRVVNHHHSLLIIDGTTDGTLVSIKQAMV